MKEMENPHIVGGTPEDKEETARKLSEHAEASREVTMRWEGIEKTPEQIRWIGMVNKFIGEEVERLKLEHTPIEEKQVRFLTSPTSWAYSNMVKSDDPSHGKSDHMGRIISVNVERIKKDSDGTVIDQRLKEFAVLLHEALHESGHIKYDIRNEDKKISVYRAGYSVGKNEGGQSFDGFNEGMTDLLTVRLLGSHEDEIKEEFGVELTKKDDRNDRNSIWNYINYRDFAIISADAWHDGDNFDKLWRGYFSGDMMQLRGIEKRFGKGALRLLSMLTTHYEGSESFQRMQKIAQFFDEDTSEEEREAIKLELL